MSSFEDSSIAAIETLRAWLIVLSIAIVVTLGVAIWGFAGSLANENTTCRIQSRGLQGQQYLVSFLSYLDQIAVQPLTAAQRREQAMEPSKMRTLDREAIAALNGYVASTAKQPKTRAC